MSTKQIFLKRLEEEDISTDIEPSVEATEKPNNRNTNTDTSPRNASYHHGQPAKDSKDSPRNKRAKNTKPLKQLDEDEEDEPQDTAILQSLTSKLFLTADGYEFQRLEQLRSDTASEIIPYDSNFTNNCCRNSNNTPSFNDDTNIEVVFEKVKYKEDVRYLRHTPSTASLDNYFINTEQDHNLTNISHSITNNINCNNCQHTVIHNHNHNNNNNSNAINLNNPLLTNRGLETQQNYYNSQHHLNHLLPVNVSLGCKSDGNYHQFIIGQERDYFYKLTPVVKWDINGNSLEDDLDNFHSFNFNDANNSPAKSSLRSSSTTLETWLEDE